MHEVLINHPKLQFEHRTGSEGPRHDPYHYDEWHVTTPKGEVVLHEGLGTWLKVNGKELEHDRRFSYNDWERYLRETAFPIYTGYPLGQLQRLAHRIKSRCRECGSRDFRSEAGYPGEYFDVCEKCGHIQGGYFNESEVM